MLVLRFPQTQKLFQMKEDLVVIMKMQNQESAKYVDWIPDNMKAAVCQVAQKGPKPGIA